MFESSLKGLCTKEYTKVLRQNTNKPLIESLLSVSACQFLTQQKKHHIKKLHVFLPQVFVSNLIENIQQIADAVQKGL